MGKGSMPGLNELSDYLMRWWQPDEPMLGQIIDGINKVRNFLAGNEGLVQLGMTTYFLISILIGLALVFGGLAWLRMCVPGRLLHNCAARAAVAHGAKRRHTVLRHTTPCYVTPAAQATRFFIDSDNMLRFRRRKV